MSNVLIVSVSETMYGVPVHDVIEVLDDVTITPVPGVASAVRGVTRYKRGVVAVLPLSQIVGLPTSESATSVTVVVVRSGSAPVAIQVDDAIDVIEVDRPNRSAVSERWCIGSIQHAGVEVQLVDVASVAAQLEESEVFTAS